MTTMFVETLKRIGYKPKSVLDDMLQYAKDAQKAVLSTVLRESEGQLVVRLGDEQDGISKRLANLEKTYYDFVKQMSDVEQENSSLRQEVLSLKAHERVLQEEIESLTVALDGSRTNAKAIGKDLEESQSAQEDMKKELKALQEKCSKQEDDLMRIRSERDELKNGMLTGFEMNKENAMNLARTVTNESQSASFNSESSKKKSPKFFKGFRKTKRNNSSSKMSN